MLFPIGNREDFKKVEELASLKTQVKEVSLQDKLDNQNFNENLKKMFESLTDTIKNSSEDSNKN